MLIAAGCSVNHHNMYGQTPTEMAANAGHQQIVLVLMQSQLLMQADVFFSPLKETDKCKNYHASVFLEEIGTRHCKSSDFGMNQYLTSGWHKNHYSGKLKCDIE